MHVGLVGSGVALDLVAEQAALTDAAIEYVDEDDLAGVDIVVVVGDAGDGSVESVATNAVAEHRPVLTIERGGIGGRAIDGLDTTIGVFAPDGPCFSCLQTRLAGAGVTADGRVRADETRLRIAGALAGRELVAIVRGEATAGRGRIIELPYRERTLLPVPGCGTCDPGWEHRWERSTAGETRSLTAAIDAADRCMDDRIGLVTEIGEAASLPIPYYLATVADTSTFSDATAPPHAAGVADDWNLAYMKAMGEALERYAAASYRTDQFELAHPADLDGAIPPDRWVRPADREPVTDPIPWVPGTELGTGTERWIPADTVVFPPQETHVRPPITSGLALGNTAAETMLSGLLEVIERDATMLAWYSAFDPVELRVPDPVVDRLRRRAAVENLDVHVVLLTQDVDVPVIGGFVSRSGAWPRFAAGSAAGFDPIETARDALGEALQNWTELSEMGRARAEEESPRIARYAADPSAVEAFFHSGVDIAAADVAESIPDQAAQRLERLVDRVREADMTPAVAWLTPRDLQRMDFHAARVVVPEAQPLVMGTVYFGERAEEVPRSMGFVPRLDREPHPFP